jgi:RNA polymerase-binding protein DksA
VATNLKPRKNQAGMLTKELEHFRDLLLEKRREIVGDMSSMEREALRSGSGSNLSTLPIHMADMGTDNYEQEFTLGLVEKDRNLLREINNALAKIQNGAYGMCEGTGKPIAKARLEAQPWARFSIEYARKIEKGVMGVR